MTTLETALRKHFAEICDLLEDYEVIKRSLKAAQDGLAMARIEVDAVGSLLLDIQQECIEHRQRADRFERLLVEHKKTAKETSCPCVTRWWPDDSAEAIEIVEENKPK